MIIILLLSIITIIVTIISECHMKMTPFDLPSLSFSSGTSLCQGAPLWDVVAPEGSMSGRPKQSRSIEAKA